MEYVCCVEYEASGDVIAFDDWERYEVNLRGEELATLGRST